MIIGSSFSLEELFKCIGIKKVPSVVLSLSTSHGETEHWNYRLPDYKMNLRVAPVAPKLVPKKTTATPAKPPVKPAAAPVVTKVLPSTPVNMH